MSYKPVKPISIVPVILSGGSGTRLWPLSRAEFPKQFLTFSGETSLFQQVVSRLDSLTTSEILIEETLVITREVYRYLALDQLREVNAEATILLEPEGRNTAPALTIASLKASENKTDPVLVVLSADQSIENSQSFTNALQQSVRAAAAGAIVILGIKPDKPDTGFGYIKYTDSHGMFGDFHVDKFVEKPNLTEAIRYLSSGDYAWNGGMFVLRASLWLEAIEKLRPDIKLAADSAWNARSIDKPFIRPDPLLFNEIPSVSIDYAVMEKAPNSGFDVRMIPLNVGWTDLGAWDALWRFGVPDSRGNVTSGDVILEDTSNSYIHSSGRLVSVVGLTNLVVVETPDAVLVVDKAKSQDVRKIVTQLSEKNRLEANLHRKVYRPWGWYDTIEKGNNFKVKRIMVKPGASLSLQKHEFRAEHWVVIRGVASIINGDQSITLVENESVYIPRGALHRLSNFGDLPLEVIEVQSGEYLEEDDIVRFEDEYGRSQ